MWGLASPRYLWSTMLMKQGLMSSVYFSRNIMTVSAETLMFQPGPLCFMRSSSWVSGTNQTPWLSRSRIAYGLATRNGREATFAFRGRTTPWLLGSTAWPWMSWPQHPEVNLSIRPDAAICCHLYCGLVWEQIWKKYSLISQNGGCNDHFDFPKCHLILCTKRISELSLIEIIYTNLH